MPADLRMTQQTTRERKRRRKDVTTTTPTSPPVFMLGQDELSHVWKFLDLLDGPLSFISSCRYFYYLDSEHVYVLQSCSLNCLKWFDEFGVSFRGKQILQHLYTSPKDHIIAAAGTTTPRRRRRFYLSCLLRNPNVNPAVIHELQLMAIQYNDATSMKLLLAHPECDCYLLDRLLDKALIHDKTQLVTILQEDPRVQDSIVKCTLCHVNPACLNCKFENSMVHSTSTSCCAGPHKGKRYCMECVRDKVCMVCEQHQCGACCRRDQFAVVNEYRPCSTCGNIVCRFIRFSERRDRSSSSSSSSSSYCYEQCVNHEVCGNIQCLDCSSNNDLRWYRCPSSHLFCNECDPTILAYDIQEPIIDGGSNPMSTTTTSLCPACNERGSLRHCINSELCGRRLERNTKDSDWFRCPDNPKHMYCFRCDPTKPSPVQECYIECGVHVQRSCPECQGSSFFISGKLDF